MTPIEPSDDDAEAAARPSVAETSRAERRPTVVASPQTVAAVWNEAHALYLGLRREYAATGPEIANFDNAWAVWTADPPSFDDPEALTFANRALLFYKKAGSRLAGQAALVQRGSERSAYAQRVLPPYWDLGTELSRLAALIEATRPATPTAGTEAPSDVPVGGADELRAHLDTLDSGVSKVLATITALRKAAIP